MNQNVITDKTTYEIQIQGLVQGIGYRPFVARLAEENQLSGWVKNTAGIVTVAVSGPKDRLDLFVDSLKETTPPGGYVLQVDVKEVKELLEGDFVIISSDDSIGCLPTPLIPVDLPTCPDCERELFDQNDRRYRHPFISCVNCGPRYSIINSLPYDRDTIVMDKFPMCPKCQSEYVTKKDRRRHAQTIACKECGPKLSVDIDELQLENTILAVKDIGGYHLVCSPFEEKTVAALRQLKGREDKPFAVCFESVEQIKDFCQVSDQEAKLLTGTARPIVLLEKKPENPGRLQKDDSNQGGQNRIFVPSCCGNSPYVGAMLCCNPVQLMLVKKFGPLIMTSANFSGELMITENQEMERFFEVYGKDLPEEIKLLIVSHDRDILVPLDDSIQRVVAGRTITVRRARGFVPNPILVNLQGSYFAAGGDLKATFAYVQEKKAYMSAQLGDLEAKNCQENYFAEKDRMKRLFGFTPKEFICDYHPAYISANQKFEGQPFKVYHHMAHAASVICEYDLKGPVLGVAFDGTGYGEDKTIWGSEFFCFDGNGQVKRVNHLQAVSLAGGNEGAKNATLSMYGYLSLLDESPKASTVDASKLAITKAAVKMNINRIKSSSMGRLFDAVSAFLGVCNYNGYEGQAPIELEYLAYRANKAYDLTEVISPDAVFDSKKLFELLDQALALGVPASELALGFHELIAQWILAVAKREGIKQVALGGGTFLNRILLERAIGLLEKEGFLVYVNSQVPPSDGGLALGQAWLKEYLCV